jgi:hypothetical protein
MSYMSNGVFRAGERDEWSREKNVRGKISSVGMVLSRLGKGQRRGE